MLAPKVYRFSLLPCSYPLFPVTVSRAGTACLQRQALCFSKCTRGLHLHSDKSFYSSRYLNISASPRVDSMDSRAHSIHRLVPVSRLEDAKDANGASAPPSEEDEMSSIGGYQLPPSDIRKIVDAPPTPALSFSPNRDKILFLKRRSLPPLSELARPEEKLAGIRIDGNCNTRSRMSFYTGIGIHKLMDDDTLGPEVEVFGFPNGAKINFVSWSRDGQHLSFSIRFDQEDNTSSKLSLWVADVETGQARPLFGTSEVNLNAVFDNFVWIDDSTLIVCTIPSSRGEPPKKPLIPSGPKIQSNEEKNVVQVRTYQDLLKDKYDEDLFDYYATSQLLWVSLDGTIKPIGPPAIYTSIDPSPDRKYLMVTSIHRPYSFIVPCGRFPKKVEVWTSEGKFVRELCDLPLAENIPIAFNSVRKGMRSINWRPDKPSSLYWAETQDGGDAKVEVSPRDIIYTQSAEPQLGEELEVLHKLDLRYGDTGEKERIWESDKEKYYETVVALMSDQIDGDLDLDKLKILTSKESKTENPQYFLESWPDRRISQITNFPHPYPQLSKLQKEMIRYERKDGVQLTATLYLPPDFDASKDGPLPMLVWSYPGEFKSKDAAGQVRGSPNEFAGIGSTSALLWLARGFAILSGPTIPIIGEGDEEANDRYVEQLVASAEAAVDEVVRRGVAHPDKIAVGGHSYGAFMTANLLAHAPHLFCCGIARSGAYNRTLTPFGFQSERFFNALKGHGSLCRLVILPFESHGFSGRESIMHVLWETDRWLQKFCVNSQDSIPTPKSCSQNDNADKEDKFLAGSIFNRSPPTMSPKYNSICRENSHFFIFSCIIGTDNVSDDRSNVYRHRDSS